MHEPVEPKYISPYAAARKHPLGSAAQASSSSDDSAAANASPSKGGFLGIFRRKKPTNTATSAPAVFKLRDCNTSFTRFYCLTEGFSWEQLHRQLMSGTDAAGYKKAVSAAAQDRVEAASKQADSLLDYIPGVSKINTSIKRGKEARKQRARVAPLTPDTFNKIDLNNYALVKPLNPLIAVVTDLHEFFGVEPEQLASILCPLTAILLQYRNCLPKDCATAIKNLRLMLEHGAKPSISPYFSESPLALLYAIAQIDHDPKHIKTALRLFEEFEFGIDDLQFANAGLQFNFLHYASFHGLLKEVQLLLKVGADVNATDSSGRTVLEYLDESSADQAIKALIFAELKPHFKFQAIDEFKFRIGNAKDHPLAIYDEAYKGRLNGKETGHKAAIEAGALANIKRHESSALVDTGIVPGIHADKVSGGLEFRPLTKAALIAGADHPFIKRILVSNHDEQVTAFKAFAYAETVALDSSGSSEDSTVDSAAAHGKAEPEQVDHETAASDLSAVLLNPIAQAAKFLDRIGTEQLVVETEYNGMNVPLFFIAVLNHGAELGFYFGDHREDLLTTRSSSGMDLLHFLCQQYLQSKSAPDKQAKIHATISKLLGCTVVEQSSEFLRGSLTKLQDSIKQMFLGNLSQGLRNSPNHISKDSAILLYIFFNFGGAEYWKFADKTLAEHLVSTGVINWPALVAIDNPEVFIDKLMTGAYHQPADIDEQVSLDFSHNKLLTKASNVPLYFLIACHGTVPDLQNCFDSTPPIDLNLKARLDRPGFAPTELNFIEYLIRNFPGAEAELAQRVITICQHAAGQLNSQIAGAPYNPEYQVLVDNALYRALRAGKFIVAKELIAKGANYQLKITNRQHETTNLADEYIDADQSYLIYNLEDFAAEFYAACTAKDWNLAQRLLANRGLNPDSPVTGAEGKLSCLIVEMILAKDYVAAKDLIEFLQEKNIDPLNFVDNISSSQVIDLLESKHEAETVVRQKLNQFCVTKHINHNSYQAASYSSSSEPAVVVSASASVSRSQRALDKPTTAAGSPESKIASVALPPDAPVMPKRRAAPVVANNILSTALIRLLNDHTWHNDDAECNRSVTNLLDRVAWQDSSHWQALAADPQTLSKADPEQIKHSALFWGLYLHLKDGADTSKFIEAILERDKALQVFYAELTEHLLSDDPAKVAIAKRVLEVVLKLCGAELEMAGASEPWVEDTKTTAWYKQQFALAEKFTPELLLRLVDDHKVAHINALVERDADLHFAFADVISNWNEELSVDRIVKLCTDYAAILKTEAKQLQDILANFMHLDFNIINAAEHNVADLDGLSIKQYLLRLLVDTFENELDLSALVQIAVDRNALLDIMSINEAATANVDQQQLLAQLEEQDEDQQLSLQYLLRRNGATSSRNLRLYQAIDSFIGLLSAKEQAKFPGHFVLKTGRLGLEDPNIAAAEQLALINSNFGTNGVAEALRYATNLLRTGEHDQQPLSKTKLEPVIRIVYEQRYQRNLVANKRRRLFIIALGLTLTAGALTGGLVFKLPHIFGLATNANNVGFYSLLGVSLGILSTTLVLAAVAKVVKHFLTKKSELVRFNFNQEELAILKGAERSAKLDSQAQSGPQIKTKKINKDSYIKATEQGSKKWRSALFLAGDCGVLYCRKDRTLVTAAKLAKSSQSTENDAQVAIFYRNHYRKKQSRKT